MRQHADKSHNIQRAPPAKSNHANPNYLFPNPLNHFPIPSTRETSTTPLPSTGSITMSSELKSETARMNGAKSNGPVTPEGKLRSSANSRKHGFNSETIILPGEDAEHFQLLLADYMDQFQPQTGVETDLVEILAVSRWRLRRLLSIEAHQLHLERGRRKKEIAEEFSNMDHGGSVAFVFQKLSDQGDSLKLILRYEATINRSYEKALKQLEKLQSSRPSIPSSGAPPEPSEDPVGSFRNPDPEPAPTRIPPEPATPPAETTARENGVEPVPCYTFDKDKLL